MDHNFGKRLTQARLARGFTVEDAAKATRMRPGLVRSLEDGNLTQFPNAAYAKSFLLLYAKYLEVDVSDVANAIDTSTQMRVEDFQYLSSRASEDRRLQKDATDTRYDFVVPQKSGGSWLPLIVVVVVAALGVVGFVVWSNLNRLDPTVASIPSTTVAPVHDAVQPAPEIAEKEPVKEPEPLEFLGPPLPPPVVVASEPPAPPVPGITPSPLAPTAPTPGNAMASATGRPLPPLLEDELPPVPPVGPAAPVPVAPAVPPPPAPEETTTPEIEPNTIVIEPHKKAWIVIRNGPGGQTLYEDYLYPSAKPMHLPAGRYFIELRDASAVEITKNGKVISYTAPGVLVD